VKLDDPEQYEQVAAVLEGQPGIDRIVDQSRFLDRLFSVTRVFRVGVLLVSFVMLISAAVLIANTVRMGCSPAEGDRHHEARRRDELADPPPVPHRGPRREPHRRLAAILFLFGMKVAFINPLYDTVEFVPWVTNTDVIALVPALLIAGALVAVVASLVGMRRFLDV